MLAVAGSVSLDTIRTPGRTLVNTLGGSAAYAGISASYFTKTGLIGVVGTNLAQRHRRTLARHVDLDGLRTEEGRTFHYDARYGRHLESRTTLKVEIGVTGTHAARTPDSYKKCRFVYLANSDPEQNVRILEGFENPKFAMCDTIDLWINTKRAAVIRMIKKAGAAVINYEEARLLTKEHGALACAKKISSWGAEHVVVKKDEHGALLYSGGEAYPYPAFPVRRPVDPTGAGDAFAGAVMGYLESGGSYGARAIRRAVAYGIIMGAMTVEKYGIRPLLGLDRRAIDARMREYERITGF